MCTVCSDFADRRWAGRVVDSYGAIAQLEERFHGMEEVEGSIPSGSTTAGLAAAGPASPFALAGFVAGEGYFSVTRKLPPFRNGDPRLRFVFGVQVALRDRSLLDALRSALGCGSVREAEPRRAHWQPAAVYSVGSIRAQRSSVIPFFSAHLIGSAKRHQFDLWVAALNSYEAMHPTRYGQGPSICRCDGCERPVRGQGPCRSHYYELTGH
jgi:hypothetical protein